MIVPYFWNNMIFNFFCFAKKSWSIFAQFVDHFIKIKNFVSFGRKKDYCMYSTYSIYSILSSIHIHMLYSCIFIIVSFKNDFFFLEFICIRRTYCYLYIVFNLSFFFFQKKIINIIIIILSINLFLEILLLINNNK